MILAKYVLIIVMSTSSSSQSGAAGIVAEFDNLQTCMVAQTKILSQLTNSGEHLLSYGCYAK